MSGYKCVLLLLFLTVPICAQQKAGTLKIKPYTFANDKKEKVDAEFGTLARSRKPLQPANQPDRARLCAF